MATIVQLRDATTGDPMLVNLDQMTFSRNPTEYDMELMPEAKTVLCFGDDRRCVRESVQQIKALAWQAVEHQLAPLELIARVLNRVNDALAARGQ